MFGRRPDGKKVKNLPGFYTIVPIIMKDRNDSMTFITLKIELDPLDKFIHEQKEKTGRIYSYIDIICAGMVRTICLRPDLNRFVMNYQIYQRNAIYFSLAVQKTLKSGAESNETTIKCKFTGEESIDEIVNQIDEKVKEVKHVEAESKTDKLANLLTSVPTGIIVPLVRTVMWADKHGLLPMKILDASPFHTTFFITDMKSIKLPTLHHHIYNFGTTGLFLSTGIEEKEVYIDSDGSVKDRSIMHLGFVSDERFCDGYYFSASFRLFQKIMKNPDYLLERLEPEDVPEDQNKKVAREKQEKKDEKREKRVAKKEKRHNKGNDIPQEGDMKETN